MKKFIQKVALFLLLFILINISYLFIIQKIDWNYSKRIEALNMNDPKYDVLVLGNSLAMDGIDTKHLSGNGYASYNSAIGGSSLKTTCLQLQEYLSLYEHKPKFVILGLGSYLNRFDNEKINPIVEFTMEGKQYNIHDIPILKFKWLFKEQLKKLFSKSHREAYLINGQLRFNKTVSDISQEVGNKSFPLDEYLSSKVLKSIIDICNNNDIKLIILEMPGFKETRHAKTFDYYVIDKELNNGILYDFNYYEFGNNFDDDKDWIGNSHLNEKGARKLSQYIIRILDRTSTNAQ